MVDGEPLLDPGLGLGGDDLFVSAAQVAIASGCRTGPASVKGSRRGTTVKATWEGCAGVTGKVKLKAKIDPSCQTLTGTLGAKKAQPRLKRKFTASLTSSAVRACDYVPGVSQPAVMPPEVVDPPDPPPPPPPDPPPDPTPVSAETTTRQIGTLNVLWNVVNDVYVYPDFNGVDWPEVGDRYQALIEQGLTDEDFYKAMALMIGELGDEHSQFQSPQEVAEDKERLAQGKNFVGIGTSAIRLPDDQGAAVVVVFPNSPAAEAGLKPHDRLLAVDGLPFFDEFDTPRTLGTAGTSLSLTFQRPGETPQTIDLVRRAITAFLPISSCIVQGTRIGYILLPSFFSGTIDEQTRRAVQDMTLAGPLEGLVLDNRMNGGGSSTIVLPILALFADGLQGHFVSRADQRELRITAEDVGGSQSVPLVVLTDHDTVSFGEIFSGILQDSGRAVVAGGPSAGNVETLHGYDPGDGSMLWIAQESFQPLGLAPGVWEGVGILPDVPVPTRWDLFTEETDPALAAAVDRLLAP